MFIDFMLERIAQNKEATALVWNKTPFTYGWLLDQIQQETVRLRERNISAGDVVLLEADFSPYSVSVFLSLVDLGCILVPLQNSLVAAKKNEFSEIAQAEKRIRMEGEEWELTSERSEAASHELLVKLKENGHPGVVLFSSGSTGKSKGMVHDFVPLLQKYQVPRHAHRMFAFLLFDHIGGMNTMLHSLSNAGCLVTLQRRTPEEVCELIERFQVEVLPTSPTFLNLLLLSEAYRNYDLSSLKTITYGTEIMSENTLQALKRVLPDVRLLQTYGLSEIGILRSKSESSDSLWVKVGGEGINTRIVGGMLEVKTPSAMLGYLNAPSPFSEDGWFMTGDMVEVKEDYVRFLGRKSEIINVGGEKVFPIEIENVLQQMEGVVEVAVTSEANVITGQMVKATFHLNTEEDLPAFRKRMRAYCQDKLPQYKVPQKVIIGSSRLHNERFKKMR